MRQPDTISYTPASGGSQAIKRPFAYRSGRRCRALKLKCTIPIKNTSGAPKDLTAAEIGGGVGVTCVNGAGLLQAAFAAIKLWFGFSVEDIQHNYETFNSLRRFYITLTGRDFIFQGAALGDYSDSAANKVTIAAGATANVILYLVLPFYVQRLQELLNFLAPGATQMRQLGLDIKCNASSTADLEFPSAITVQVMTDDVDDNGREDPWCPVPRIHKSTVASQDQAGPAAGGGLLALTEVSAVGISTALTQVSVLRADDEPLHDNVNATEIVADSVDQVPPGDINPNLHGTVLYQLPESCGVEDIPTSEAFGFRQASLVVAQPVTHFYYIPTVTESYADESIGKNATGQEGHDEVKAYSPLATERPSIRPSVASILPVALVKREDPRFHLVPGRIFAKGATPTIHIPDAIRMAAGQAAGAQSNSTAQAGALAGIGAKVASALPGGTSPSRGTVRAQGKVVLELLTPPGLKALLSAAGEQLSKVG